MTRAIDWCRIKADPVRHAAHLEQKRRWREAVRLEDPRRHQHMLLRKAQERVVKGFILYEGASMIDGAPIVCIVTDPDQSRLNSKTQRVIQTYILRADIDPITAVATGADHAICGDCKHRAYGEGIDSKVIGGSHQPQQRSCYVQVWSAPRNVWLAYNRGKYRKAAEPSYALAGEVVRLGTYGDPAAVPLDIWSWALKHVKSTIGYTHQWKREYFQQLNEWCMASVDNEAEYHDARVRGWRTFRVRRSDQPLMKSEINCPASAEAGKRSNCAECRACGGLSAKAVCDIAIIVHGDKGKISAFREK